MSAGSVEGRRGSMGIVCHEGCLASKHRIEISMDGRGRCHDNIFVERLWDARPRLGRARVCVDLKKSAPQGLSGALAGFHLSRNQNQSLMLLRCCEVCGQPPTCGQGGGNAERFPRLVHRGPRLRGQAGIGAADCPQIHSTAPPLRYAAFVATGAIVPK
jgi:hypothetical protein